MAKMAVIKTGGKQYKVKEGQTVKVEKLVGDSGAKLKLETLLTGDSESGEVLLGKPSLGEKVEAEIVEQGRNDKVLVVKYKSKVRYKKSVGHRQAFTKIKINTIA